MTIDTIPFISSQQQLSHFLHLYHPSVLPSNIYIISTSHYGITILTGCLYIRTYSQSIDFMMKSGSERGRRSEALARYT
jgi:hypothetical protein